MVDNAERKIMDMVEQGQLSAEEGLRLINAMGGNHPPIPDPGGVVEDVLAESVITVGDEQAREIPRIPEEEIQRMNRLKKWWLLPFGVGLLVTTLGAIWMYMGFSEHGFGVGFWLAWIPFLLGIFIVAISFRTNRSVWLHVRIKQPPGETPQRISISLPMPIALTRWFMSAFGDRIPGLKEQPFDNAADILGNLSPEEPFYVHVNDDDGEEVEVYIG